MIRNAWRKFRYKTYYRIVMSQARDYIDDKKKIMYNVYEYSNWFTYFTKRHYDKWQRPTLPDACACVVMLKKQNRDLVEEYDVLSNKEVEKELTMHILKNE